MVTYLKASVGRWFDNAARLWILLGAPILALVFAWHAGDGGWWTS